MYNRYIPQSDGSYRRSSVREPVTPRPEPPKEPDIPRCDPPEPVPVPPCRQGQNCPHRGTPCRTPPPKHKPLPETHNSGIGSFFRQLLPRDFDTEDLLIVLLLLLMGGDCPEDQNTALLTLGLYLFL